MEFIQACQNNQINIEYSRLSSILDMLDDIGNYFEDLVTVSTKNRIEDFSKLDINKSRAEEINNKFIYPSKILKLSQEYYDKAMYVKDLRENNDIKNGIINSKAIHSNELAKWSYEFSKIYLQDFNEVEQDIKNINDPTVSNKQIPQTGKTIKICVITVTLIFIGIIALIRYKKISS